MSSTAISAQGCAFKIGVAAAAKNITAITKAFPVQITAAAHGFADGDVVKVAGVGGMTELNGKVGVVTNAATNTFELAGIDSTGYTTFTTGGTATPSQVEIGNVRTFSGLDGQASEIDVTNFKSTAKEKRLGLQDFGSFSLELDVYNADEGQMALQSGKACGEVSTFEWTLPNGEIATFDVLVKGFSMAGAVDDVIKGSVSLSITGNVAWS